MLQSCNYKTKETLEKEKQHKEEEQNRILVQKTIFYFIIYEILNKFKQNKREMTERKKIIQKFDNDRKKNEKLDEIDELAKEEAEYLLKKANEMRQEDEDEIKRLNEVFFFI